MRGNKYEEILSVAAHLIAQKGYNGVSFQEIANKVGIHKSTLFHYVNNKEQLLLRILEKSIDELNIYFEKLVNSELEPQMKLEKAIDYHLTLLIKNVDNGNIYLNELRSLPKKTQVKYYGKRKQHRKNFERIIVEMQKKGYLKGINAKIATLGLLGMLNWSFRWYKPGGPLTAREISKQFYRIMTKR